MVNNLVIFVITYFLRGVALHSTVTRPLIAFTPRSSVRPPVERNAEGNLRDNQQHEHRAARAPKDANEEGKRRLRLTRAIRRTRRAAADAREGLGQQQGERHQIAAEIGEENEEGDCA